MPLRHYRPLPPALDIIVPAAPAVLTLSIATATTSPAPDSTVTNRDSDSTLPHRSGSTRIDRVKELLTPTLKESRRVEFYSSATSRPVGERMGKCGGSEIGKAEMGMVGSQIEFFERHPLDSRNPMTFLGGGCGVGDGCGREVQSMLTRSSRGSDEKKATEKGMVDAEGSAGEGEKEGKQRKEGSTPYPTTPIDSASPPRDIPGAAGATIVVLPYPRSTSPTLCPSSPVPIISTHPPESYTIHEVPILEARPATLYEMPGRFRSTETCWYCADWTMGARCAVCGARIRGVCGIGRKY
ncbi:MAG: hypothetical protein Q9207_005951 [Kuettlingeria erythrocarpa]